MPLANPDFHEKQPTLVRSSTLRVTSQEQDSQCWLQAKVRFRTRILQLKRPPTQEHLNDFLRNNVNINKAISECERLKAKADKRYEGKLGKLLGVLSVLKDTGDAVLTCAPESVSIAWGIISLFVGIGTNDMENCGQISEASTNIVTIILNCRLYENRHTAASKELEKASGIAERATEAITELITVILEFFWHASRKFREDNKLKRFGDIFNIKSTANEKYEEIISQYKNLRDMANVQFEESVMGWLHEIKCDNAKLAERLKSENEEILRALILPDIQSIRDKLDIVHLDVKEIRSDVKDLSQDVKYFLDDTALRALEQATREKFDQAYGELKTSDAHIRQLALTLEPLRRRLGTRHISRWLFNHKDYQSWEKGQQRFLYLKGQPGFGKSVTLAVAVERLLESYSEHRISAFERYNLSPRLTTDEAQLTSREDKISPVIFFFFKRGDDETQFAKNAVACLLAQLFHPKFATTRERMEAFLEALEATPEETLETNTQNILVDTTETEEDQPGHHGAARKAGLGSRDRNAQVGSINSNLAKLERIARAIGKTVYVVLDGIDECADHHGSGLLQGLMRLMRSKDSKFQFLVSSRDNLGLEKFFAVAGKEPQGVEDISEMDNGIHSEAHGDVTVLTVNKSTNRDDMRAYLEDSLTELLDYGSDLRSSIAGPGYNDKNDLQTTHLSQKQIREIKRMVETIQKKAEGMFTYSAMVVASLRQPSPLSIKRRVNQLPDEMDSLYSKHLESLTMAQRKLVILALRRIVNSPSDIKTLEIVDQFKKEYLESNEGGDRWDSDDSDDNSEDNTHPARKSQSRTNSRIHPAETFEKEMRKPEVIYTIRHLEIAGREFFKFSDGKRTIELIHKSVLDWVERESKKAEEIHARQLPVADFFKIDANGEMKITVPKFFIEGHSVSTNIQSQRETDLDNLLYILEVLSSKKFQDKYLPDFPDEYLEALGLLTDISEPTNADTGIPLTSESKKPKARQVRKVPLVERGEISHLAFHMDIVSKNWPEKDRFGPKWNKLKGLLRKISSGETFKRWSTQFLLRNSYGLEELLVPTGLVTPGFLAAQFEWDIYLDFLLKDNQLNYDFGKDINSSVFGLTILHISELYYWPQIFEAIYTKFRPGRDFESLEDEYGYTPFLNCLATLEEERSAQGRKFLIVTLKLMLMLDCEPDLCLNIIMPESTSLPLSYAFKGGDIELIEMILQKYGSDPELLDLNYPDGIGRTALHVVWDPQRRLSRHTQVEIAKRLLEAGADVNVQDFESTAPLAFAALALNAKGVELLLESGANVNDDDSFGNTAFMSLVSFISTTEKYDATKQEEAIKILRILKNAGANIKLRTKHYETTALAIAIKNKKWEIAKVILEMHKTDLNGYQILQYAAELQELGIEVEKFLIEHTDDSLMVDLLEGVDSNNRNPLDAALFASPNYVPFYLGWHYHYCQKTQKESDAAADSHLWLPRSLAIKVFWQPAVLKMMETDYLGKHALKAFMEDHPYKVWFLHIMVSTLLHTKNQWLEALKAAGADPLVTDEEGWDAFDWAYAYHTTEFIGEYFPKELEDIDYSHREQNRMSDFKINGWAKGHSANIIGDDKLSVVLDPALKTIDKQFQTPGVTTNNPVSPYTRVYYYEITVLGLANPETPPDATIFIGIGFTTDEPTLVEMPGWLECSRISFGLHSDDGNVYSPVVYQENGQNSKVLRSGIAIFGIGDTVGCGYDQIKHTIFWTLNGKHLGVGFENVKERLWPIVTGRGFKISTNFGLDPAVPFVWKAEESEN